MVVGFVGERIEAQSAPAKGGGGTRADRFRESPELPARRDIQWTRGEILARLMDPQTSMRFQAPPLVAALFALATPVYADIVINEIGAIDSGRQLRWDADDQPFAGSGPAWWSPGFSDALWDVGPTPIGFELGAIATNVGAALDGVSPSLYVRKTFTASAGDAASGSDLILRINYNDGFIAWINGKEADRANMGAEKAHIYHDQISYRSTPNSTATQDFNLGAASAFLTDGANLLAIQVGNYTLDSSLRLDAELFINAPGGAVTLVASGTTIRYLPGLIEPTADPYEPAAPEEGASDWIELHNTGASPVDLTGWHLTDDAASPIKWTFPPGSSIGAGGYLVVLADAPDAAIPGAIYAHTNFKLSADGEYVGLANPAGTVIDAIAPGFPEQYPYHSYGRPQDGSTFTYLESPTPGSTNDTAALAARVDTPDFDIGGGFFDTSVAVGITSQTPGAQIRYTTDGTDPTLATGIPYVAPLTLNQVTNIRGHVIRARAFADGMIPSPIRTHTYLIGQDNRLRQNPAVLFAGDVPRSLHDPFGILAIVGGTYVNSQWEPTGPDDVNNILNRGRAYERPIHAEFYFPDGTVGFRSDCGLRASASAFSRPRARITNFNSSPWPSSAPEKPSFNLYFRDEYGNPSVDLPLNGPDHPVDDYERLRLRAGKNDIQNPFITDELVRRLSADMGQPASQGVINSFYINGVFKGYYNTVERLREPFFRSLHSADPDAQWDVLQLENADGGGEFDNVAEGDRVAWEDMIVRLNRAVTPANWDAVREVADVTNIADYFILNIYGATWDWPHNNWVAAKERSPAGRYRLYIWDAEGAFNTAGNRPVGQEMINSFIASGAGELRDLWRGLNRWEEFRLHFADRIQKHLFNGGVLDDRDYENSQIKLRIDQLVDEFSPLRSLVHNGSAVSTAKYTVWTNPTNGRRSYLFGPNREEFRNANVWPTTAAPSFSRFGGSVDEDFPLFLTSEDGIIYFTTDGSDPRVPFTGVPNPAAESVEGAPLSVDLINFGDSWSYLADDTDQGTAWREPSFDDSSWPTGPAPLGYGGITNTTLGTTITDGRLITSYFRRDVEITGPAAFIDLRVTIQADAGAVVYVNGVEAVRDNMPPGAITFDTRAIGERDEEATNEFVIDPSLLTTGSNTIAVEVHNGSPVSSDLVLDLSLGGLRVNENNTPLIIDDTTTVKARTLTGGVWSALTEAEFTVATVPATGANLAVAEMLYDPLGPDGELYEYLRLQNIGPAAIALDGVQFTDGITFDFAGSPVRVIPPGGSALLVADLAAFRSRFGSGFDPTIAGEYAGKLKDEGENLRLSGPTGTIQEFAYDDVAPWPVLTGDLVGHSIQIIDPTPAASHGDGSNWRASASVGGNPGGLLSLAVWMTARFTPAQLDDPLISAPGADPDFDGWSNFLEFALGTPPLGSGNGVPLPSLGFGDLGGEARVYLEFVRTDPARDVTLTLELSDALGSWTAFPDAPTESMTNPDGSVTTRAYAPADGDWHYARLRASE